MELVESANVSPQADLIGKQSNEKIDDKNSDKQNVAKEETKLQAATDFNEYVSNGQDSQRENQTVANYERRQTEFEKELDQDQEKVAI